jgi:hypothetical protein
VLKPVSYTLANVDASGVLLVIMHARASSAGRVYDSDATRSSVAASVRMYILFF